MMLRLFIFATALLMAYPAFADTGMRVVVPNHDIARGATLSDADLVYGTIPAGNLFSGVATSMAEQPESALATPAASRTLGKRRDMAGSFIGWRQCACRLRCRIDQTRPSPSPHR